MCSFCPPVRNPGDAYFYASNTQLNWWGANEFCRRAGHRLAVIDSREKQAAVEKYIKDNGLTTKQHWIALNDLATNGKYFWSSNGQPAGWTNWIPGEPNNYQSNEHCVHITTSNAHDLFRWNDNNCARLFDFICESCC